MSSKDAKVKKETARSSRRNYNIKKGVLKNCAIFSGKQLCWSLFLLKKRLWHKCFLVNLAKFIKTPFLQNNSGRKNT